MKPVQRYQSQLLLRRSYKPNRLIKFWSAPREGITFRPSRAGPVKIRYENRKD
jgi:hypothetical protein